MTIHISLAVFTNSGVTTDGGIVGVNNQVLVTQFVLPITITVGQISFDVTTAIGGSVSAVGIYDSSGNKLVAADNVSTASTGVKTTAIGSPVTLTPGIYYFAQGSSSTGVGMTCLVTNTNWNTMRNHNTTKRQGAAANALSAGVLPSTLGTVTAALVYPVMTLLER